MIVFSGRIDSGACWKYFIQVISIDFSKLSEFQIFSRSNDAVRGDLPFIYAESIHQLIIHWLPSENEGYQENIPTDSLFRIFMNGQIWIRFLIQSIAKTKKHQNINLENVFFFLNNIVWEVVFYFLRFENLCVATWQLTVLLKSDIIELIFTQNVVTYKSYLCCLQ